MLASLSWLRALCPVEAEASEIADALTTRGLTVDAVDAAAQDHVLDIDVPANRPDCLGHLGLARELSAAFGVALAERPAAPEGHGGELASAVRVRIDEPDLCRRYTARLVRGVRVGPSPGWVVRRLEACGLRSLNNVVDVSNLVMLETGNPIHFFDLERIGGAEIRIRRPERGESLSTLDGVERSLDPATLLIADATRPIALAGVMGGADTEIGISTKEVLIEAAWFLPGSVRATARRLGLKTDAGHRFERGVDPEGVLLAQEMAVRLLVELAGGRPAPGIIDDYPRPFEPARLALRREQLPRLLGYDPAPAEILGALHALGLRPSEPDEGRYAVRVPSWRIDLEREADLVEEVARHLGYDRIPAKSSGMPSVAPERVAGAVEARARDLLTALGAHEAFTYAMIGAGEDDAFVEPDAKPALPLVNPITDWMTVLRRSLLPGLLRAVDLNLRRGVRDVRLFEIGHVFQRRGDNEFPRETPRVGLAWSGAARPRHWSGTDREVELPDLMGWVEHLVAVSRPGTQLRPERCTLAGFHPGRSVLWTTEGGEAVAWAGALHPDRQQRLPETVFLAEIDLDRVERLPIVIPRYTPLPKLTEVSRDLSLVVGPDHSYEQILTRLKEIAAPAAVAFEVIDRYVGAPLGDGESAITVRVSLRPDERTLTEAEIESYRLALIEALQRRLGIGIRGD